ncbi:hypothetical protein EUGRSUZ_B01416 [Eucalyptus grandis]|uniref:RING-type E3 ubiquitin transferase n=2 Tax=Eucalyptus grandis TaxID=71139 RepID=A0A059D2D6_EUCGR|nr:hypothetical protein EUGRSUZ_B01416 [Eucalyptus grandis]
MPPFSHPPPTRRRFAAAAALFLFFLLLLLPTPLPCAAPQPAFPSAPADDHVFKPSVARAMLILIVFLIVLSAYFAYLLCCYAVLEGPIGRSIGRSTARSLHRLASPPPRGLDPAVVETFPTAAYSAVKGHRIGDASLGCAVCLEDFEDGDVLRLIPECDHAFHPDCIGAWLASHTSCPRLPRPPRAESSTEVEVIVEAASPDASTPERSQREGGGEGIQLPGPWDMNESGSFSYCDRRRGFGMMPRFPRSHSTGHSLVRAGEDTERFALRLPAEVRKQLMDRPRPVLPQEGCSRRGYRCGGEGRCFGRPDQLDRAAKSDRWVFDRMPAFFVLVSAALSPRVTTTGGGGGGGSSCGSVQQVAPAI